MKIPRHDDNTNLDCWNSAVDLGEALRAGDSVIGHPHCGLCCDLGEAWQALEQATADHLNRVAKSSKESQREWRQGRPPRQKPGKQ